MEAVEGDKATELALKLCKERDDLLVRVQSLLESNNAYLQRARDAEYQISVSISAQRMFERAAYDLEKKLDAVHELLTKIDKRLGTLSMPDGVKRVSVEMLTEELRVDLMAALDLTEVAKR